MGRSPVLGAACGLLFFYWSLAFGYHLATHDWWAGSAWIAPSIARVGAMGVGVAAGVLIVAYAVWFKRYMGKLGLVGDDVRGVTCSIGELPVVLSPPSQAPEMPDVDELRLPRDPRVHRSWMDDWFATYEADYPAHANMLRAIGRVLNTRPDLPAACESALHGGKSYRYGWDGHNHGGHLLTEHAFVCASIGIDLAETWSFTGLEVQEPIRQGGKWKLGLRNPHYTFEKSDPLIGLLCYGHDLGKVETFGWNDKGELVALQHDHDTPGARMMARMEEFWALPDEDRLILLMAVGHYHKPQDMPLDEDKRLISDRMQALLELMIEADRVSGLIENGQVDNQGTEMPRPIVERDFREHLWDAFTDVVNEAGRINGKNLQYRVGQKNVIDGKALLFLHEESLRMCLLERMELRNSPKAEVDRDGVTRITRDLLSVMHDHGVLLTESGGHTATPQQALWTVEFYGRDRKLVGKVLSCWMNTVVMVPAMVLPKLAELPNYDSIPKITGLATSGRGREQSRRRAQEISIFDLSEEATSDDLIDPVGPTPAPPKAGPRPAATPPRRRESPDKDAARTAPAAAAADLLPSDDKDPRIARPEAANISPAPAVAPASSPLPPPSDASVLADPAVMQPEATRDDRRRAQVALAQAQLRSHVPAADRPAPASATAAPPAKPATRKASPIQRHLLRLLHRVEEKHLPGERLPNGNIALSLEAVLAIEQSRGWLDPVTIDEIAQKQHKGVAISIKDNGIFMLELDRDKLLSASN